MIVKAPAKINLALNVVSRRADGYHELQMVMTPLLLHDTLHIEFSTKDELSSDDPLMPCDEHNTIIKAIKLMRKTYDLKHHYRVHVEKRIPMQAGLAGGSSDAAALMKAINEMEELHIPQEELIALGKQIGADVCFCIADRCAYVEGIGEVLKPIEHQFDIDVLLVKPNEGVSTKEAYQTLNLDVCAHPDCTKVIDALKQNDFLKLCASLGNSLESSAFPLAPQIQEVKDILKNYGFEGVLMSGSGSCVFALSQHKELLQKAEHELKDKFPFVELTKIKL